MASWALDFTEVNHVNAISPIALLILKLIGIFPHDTAVYLKMLVVSWACDQLYAISSLALFIPVRLPLESQLALRTFNN